MGLLETLKAQAQAEEGLRFDRFMETVLYDAGHGYFARHEGRAGREGDFLTSPEASPLFAACVADWAAAQLPATGPVSVLEVGAGRGTLAAGVWNALDAEVRSRARLHLVERAEAPRKALVERFSGDARVHVYADLGQVPRLGNGVLIANELFDNLPVRRVMMADTLQEIVLRWKRGRFDEALVDADDELRAYLRRVDVRLRSGQAAEVCLEAAPFLQQAVARFDSVAVAVFDYGDQAKALLDPTRFPTGTLACHRRHGTDRNFYEDLGRKDLTAHVDFTNLAQAAEAAGLVVDPLRTQADFLVAHGIAERMVAEQEQATDSLGRLQANLRAKQVFHPDAMGGAFRVLTARPS